MDFNANQQAALRDLETAAKKMRSGSAVAEKEYGIAYNRCVTLGVKPANRKRYR
jgi:hypothetical protein